MENFANSLLDYNNLVSTDATLNQYKIGWWLALPNTFGGRFYYDIISHSNGLISASSGNGWRASFREGAYASISLNGNGDYVAVSDSEKFNFGTSDFTISGWFNLSILNNPNANGRQMIVSRYESGTGKGFTLGVSTSGSIIFELYNSLSTFTSFSSGTGTIAANTWYHFVIVRQNIFAYLYLNGRLVASGTTPTLYTISSTNQDLLFGNAVNSLSQNFYMSGQLDDICIYQNSAGSNFAFRLYEESRLSYPTTLNRIRINRTFSISAPWVYFSILQNTHGVSI